MNKQGFNIDIVCVIPEQKGGCDVGHDAMELLSHEDRTKH